MGSKISDGPSIDDRSNEFRERYLSISGGWLGWVVIFLSDITGIWDPLLLCMIGVIAWVIVRTTTMEISILLGLAFDGVIPLQYYRDDELYRLHKTHLEHYWAVLFIGTGTEVAAYLLVHPDLVTLLVCLKTVVCTWIWVGRREDGVFLSSSVTRGKNAPVSGPRISSGKSEGKSKGKSKSKSKSDDSTFSSSRHDTEASSKVKKHNGGDWSVKGHSDKEGGWWADMDELLSSWGYKDRLGRAGMIDNLSARSEKGRDDVLDKWSKPSASDRSSREKKYADEIRTKRKKELEKHPFPVDDRRPTAEKELRELYPDPLVRWGMLNSLKKMKRKEDVESNMKRWTTEPKSIRRRTAQYAKQARDKLGLGKDGKVNDRTRVARGDGKSRGDSKSRDRSDKSDGGGSKLPEIGDPRHPDVEDRLKRHYPDPTVQWGMIDYLRSSSDDAHVAKRVKAWSSSSQSAEDKKRRAEEYGRRAQVVLDLMDPGGQKSGSGLSEESREKLQRKMADASVPKEDQVLIERLLSGPRSVKQEEAVSERLKHYKIDWSCPPKHSADAPIVRPAGRAAATGLPNEWLNELDHALFTAGDPDRRKLMNKYSNGFEDYGDEQWARRAVKRYREKMEEPVPFKPGSYDSFGGTLAYSVHDLEDYRDKLMRAYPRGTVDCMLVDLKNQPTRAAAQQLMDDWIDKSQTIEGTKAVVRRYRDDEFDVNIW